jgi:hypothetical protein
MSSDRCHRCNSPVSKARERCPRCGALHLGPERGWPLETVVVAGLAACAAGLIALLLGMADLFH